ncbi:hypothetical protein K400107F7_23540 [Agathobaculum massiliense]
MRYTVIYLGAFGVVKPIQIAYQIAGDTADALKAHAFTNQRFRSAA